MPRPERVAFRANSAIFSFADADEVLPESSRPKTVLSPCSPASHRGYDALVLVWITREAPRGTSSFYQDAAVRHLGCLTSARADGKSPVEYLDDGQSKIERRRLARKLIFRPPAILDELMTTINGLATHRWCHVIKEGIFKQLRPGDSGHGKQD